MLPPPAGRPSELPVLRLHGSPGGFVVDGVAGGDDLLELNAPLNLGEDPLLLLLDNADQLPEALLERLQRLLSADERRGLEQRRQPAAYSSHGGGLALVRLLIGALLKQSPETLPIRRGPWGKPQLAPGPWPPLQFNLSHSGALLLLAVHRHRPVGVDLERHRTALRWRAVARRYLSATTVANLEATPESRQLEAFTHAWCTLEATLKADGRGLAAGAAALASTGSAEAGGGDRFQLYRPALPQGYSGAVVLAAAPSAAEAARGLAEPSTTSGAIHIASPYEKKR